MEITLPSHFSLREKIGKDYVYQFGFDKSIIEATIEEYSFNRVKGYILRMKDGQEILISKKKSWTIHDKFDKILFAKDFENIKEGDLSDRNYSWLKHPNFKEANSCQDIIDSYINAFSFKKENLELEIEGLRSPQLGGIYAALGSVN